LEFRVYAVLGRLDEAMKCYTRAVRLRPDNTEAYTRMHDILLSQGKTEQARAMLRKAAAAGPPTTHPEP
jgi:cytochrome c-type biogenesis protein CcmH/NrfG